MQFILLSVIQNMLIYYSIYLLKVLKTKKFGKFYVFLFLYYLKCKRRQNSSQSTGKNLFSPFIYIDQNQHNIILIIIHIVVNLFIQKTNFFLEVIVKMYWNSLL